MSERRTTLSLMDNPDKLLTHNSPREANPMVTPRVGNAVAPRETKARKTSFGRILIAEDHVVNQQVAKRQVETLGYAVDLVANGHEAVEAVGRSRYALVLMDCQMPEMDGLEATAEIRRREGTNSHTPIIAMTASALRQDRENCLAAGMDDFLSKPTEMVELAAVITRWLPQAEAGDSPTPEEPDLNGHSPRCEPGVGDRLELFKREFGAEMVVSMIDSFIPDAARRLIGLRKTVAVADFKNLAREAHGLKGGYGNMGAITMGELCIQLERQARSGSIDGAAAIVDQLEQDFLRLQPALEGYRNALLLTTD